MSTIHDEATQARLFREFRKVLLKNDWTPIQRVTAQMLLLQAEPKQEYGYRVIESCSAELVAGWLGVSDKTARETMMALKEAGVIDRDVRGYAVNRMGQEIPTTAMDTRRGDRFQKETTVSMPLALPDELPALSKGNNVKRARVTNAKRVAEFQHVKAELQRLLDGAQCPHCEATGTLHAHVGATCSGCGAVLSEDEVQTLAETEIISEPDGPPNFNPEPDPATVTATTRRAMRNLKGRATSPGAMAAHGDYDEGTLTIKLQIPQTEIISATPTPQTEIISVSDDPQTVKSSVLLEETVKTSVWGETLRGADVGAAHPATLTGVHTLEWFHDYGATFCLVGGKGGIKPCDDQGAPLPGNYLDMPQPLAVAVAELKRGGTVGILPEHSNPVNLLDIDHGLDSLLEMWPGLAKAPRITRRNAPGRAKLVVLVKDFGPKFQLQDAEQPTRKAELLGRGHGNVAGAHPSGAEYELQLGELMVFTREEIQNMLRQWIPTAYTAEGDKRAPTSAPLSASSPSASVDLVRAAIDWWNADPANQHQVDRLLAGCKRSGNYVAVRADDGTPSTRRTDTRENFYKRTWRDYGANRTLDDYEIYVTLNSLNKREHIWQVVNQWRVANGQPPIELTH